MEGENTKLVRNRESRLPSGAMNELQSRSLGLKSENGRKNCKPRGRVVVIPAPSPSDHQIKEQTDGGDVGTGVFTSNSI